MPTFEVDDQFHSHPKAGIAGDDALGLWVRLGSWCMCHLTDGRVPRGLPGVVHRDSQVESLLKVGLLEELPDGSYQMHDFLHWNKPAAWWHEYRAKEAQKKANKRAAARAASKCPQGSPQGTTQGTPPKDSPGEYHRSPSPSPSDLRDPSPTPPASGKGTEQPESAKPGRSRSRTMARPCPPDWHPNQTHLELARSAGHNGAWVSEQATRMRDWAEAKGSKANCADWDARFRNWIRKAADTPSVRSAVPVGPDPHDDGRREADRRIAATNEALRGKLGHIPRPVRSAEPVEADKQVVANFLGSFGKAMP